MRKRILVVILALAVVAAGAATFIALRPGGTNQPAQAVVTAQGGGSVSLGEATLTVAPGAVAGTGHLVATRSIPPAAGKGTSALASAGAPVLFSVTGTRVTGSLLITFRVARSLVPAGLPESEMAAAVWLGYYDDAYGRWQAVPSSYDAAAGTVTARVSHLSLWMPWTWDWQGMILRARQALSAFGAGRAPVVSCPPVAGVTVTDEGGKDPPMIGCAARSGNSLAVTLTNNRGLSMVMSGIPPDASLGPPSYSGFWEYLAANGNLAAALGGAILPPAGGTLHYALPLQGSPAAFTGAVTLGSYALDQAEAAADALLGKVDYQKISGDYATCVLDIVTRTGAASLADVPSLVVSCLPVLAPYIPGYAALEKTLGKRLLAALDLLYQDVKLVLQTGDLAYDDARIVQPQVTVIRPACTTASCQPTWSSPGRLAPGPVTSVSCSSDFCAAVGTAGATGHSYGYALLYYQGVGWSKPVPLGSGNRFTVSCPSAVFCVTVTSTGYAYILSNGVWSAPADIYPGANDQQSATDEVTDVSCATVGFCVAVTAAGNALTWNGTAWSGPQAIGLPGVERSAVTGGFYIAIGVSCPAANFCLAGTGLTETGDSGAAATWNGSYWTVTPSAGPVGSAWQISCASAAFCMVAGGYHAVGDQSATWNGSAWSAVAHPPDNGESEAFNQVSCPQNGFCVAVDGGAFANGYGSLRGSSVFTWFNGAWSGPQFTEKAYLDAISCTPGGLCVVGDSSGNIFVRG